MAGVKGMAGKTPMQRFYEKFDVDQAHGCWLWNKGIVFKGYGQFFLAGVIRFAHRASWELHKGPIPAGLMVLHRCDVPRCVNPDHLFLGTNTDNMRDAKAKGRLKGKHPNASKTHCKNGHEFTDDNTKVLRTGSRLCITCGNAYSNNWQKARRRAMKEVANGC